MDVLTLSRFQFGAAALFHFLFVPLTLGLSILIAMMETLWVRTGDETYKRMTKFWGKLFLINFAIGIVTGITLEFQFGTNWSRYSIYVGDVFGSLLAIEATVSFFLESTFIAVWMFGWKKLSPKMHCLSIWLVAIASNISAFWILIANAWMQHPVGYTIRNGRAELTDFIAVITQKFAVLEILHTLGGAYILSGFFVIGISAWHLLKNKNNDFFLRSFRMGVSFALVFSLFEIAQGHMNASILQTTQPTKMAAMEAHWETSDHAPINLIQWPDEKNSKNLIEALPIPNLLSILAGHTPSTTIRGLREWPQEERPPILLTFLSFRGMVGLAFLFLAISAFGFWKRKTIGNYPWFLKICFFSIPLPYLANELGWLVAEFGRQPWIVYGLMKTKDAVSTLAVSQVLTTAIGFVLLYSLLGITDFYLLAKYARKDPTLQPIKR